MGKLNFGPDMAIFVLFFGGALIEALYRQNWRMSLLYIVLAVLFLVGGVLRRSAVRPKHQ